MGYIDDIERHGFAVLQDVIDPETIRSLLSEFANAKITDAARGRLGTVFGIRDLLNVLPSTRDLANSASFRSLVEPVLGNRAKVVRGIYFDKHREANWKVAWHQDLTIAVRQRVEMDGYSPWSIKGGIHHVQPPVSVLQNMLTLRLHLDHTDQSNGPLRVLPGTHKHGRMDAREIQLQKEQQIVVTCPVKLGGVMIMRPLLLHSSLTAANPDHRRVLHFEYCSSDLPGGLEWFDC